METAVPKAREMETAVMDITRKANIFIPSTCRKSWQSLFW